jgi:hypothetical protein
LTSATTCTVGDGGSVWVVVVARLVVVGGTLDFDVVVDVVVVVVLDDVVLLVVVVTELLLDVVCALGVAVTVDGTSAENRSTSVSGW